MNRPPTLGWLLDEWQIWGKESSPRFKPTVLRWKGEDDRDVARLKQDAWMVAVRSIRPATAKSYAVGVRSWIGVTVEMTKADKQARTPVPAKVEEIQYWLACTGNAGEPRQT
ncbi:hypothetical protein FOZ60_011917 [Perkinsus olseni]|uniref:Uncharacterized protein n=1 Tax=Perkinsus olseni TaxID=32597 RepID=A0A7J6NCM9_PEROL|nr:hypothetical protein FOZ60_015145 [Perkinsus olseni]KAF4681616.1 hypothetical protein FOZ60_011917 [Perkinsus olseni]